MDASDKWPEESLNAAVRETEGGERVDRRDIRSAKQVRHIGS